jgi:hypothetical protein
MKTQLDLLTSAEATARLMLNSATAFAAEQTKLENFEATGQDPLDWPLWNQYTVQRLNEYTQLNKADAPSTTAAKEAAKQAAAAAAKAPAKTQ